VTEQVRAALPQRIGRRGAALLFFTLLDFVYCLSLLTSARPMSPLHAWMNAVAPLTAWAACWGTVGTICLWYAFRTYDTPGFMCAVGLKVAWGLNALFGWIAGQVPLGYVSAVIWLAFAAFVFLIAGGIPPAVRRSSGRRRPWTL
jgi:hypothetical protein